MENDGTCWENAGKMLGKCWENAGKMVIEATVRSKTKVDHGESGLKNMEMKQSKWIPTMALGTVRLGWVIFCGFQLPTH